MRRVMFAAAIVAVALVASAGVASADGPNSSKRGAAPNDQYKVTSVGEGYRVTPGFDTTGFTGDVVAAKRQAVGLAQTATADSTVAVTATVRCATGDAYRYGNGALSRIIGHYWEFHHMVYFCWDGTYLQGAPVSWSRPWVNTWAAGWSYKGEIGHVEYWPSWPKEYYAWRQGDFALCASYCVQHNYPWVSWRLKGSGAANYQTGG